jgi:hypothetical protein
MNDAMVELPEIGYVVSIIIKLVIELKMWMDEQPNVQPGKYLS